MSTPDQLPEVVKPPIEAQLLAHIAIAAWMVKGAVEAARSGGLEALVLALDQIHEHADLIQASADELAFNLGCSPAAVEAVRQGLGRLSNFRACQGLEGNA